ncbi:MAG: uracil-DNA glycosylase [Proteobacteria bacterium]|nr:uracil-DNA glycosylase [Desulfobulbaceae bacterium]MBU4153974.1 uracil-DNA glycosylase [Pseudomonadota bacterium]
MSQHSSTVNCLACRHFYITYEPAHPYGCRSLSFKSREMPSRVVYASSGMECQSFSKKETKLTTAG